jgi:hypothetical protein
MFTRLRETYHILTYNEKASGPDAVIVEEQKTSISNASRRIARFIEVILVSYAAGFGMTKIWDVSARFFSGKHSVSVAALMSAVAILSYLAVEAINGQFQATLRQRLDIADKLAPYFGHKLDETFRVLRG